jgi:hypothetical protein
LFSVHVVFHKDGDRLVVCDKPWWSPIYERVVSALFCPCCGLSGLFSRMDWYAVLTDRIWDRLLGVSYRREKDVFAVPIESGCVAVVALWGEHDCWRDECPVGE